MADSKHLGLCDRGLMVAAMAYRVKYRLKHQDGTVLRPNVLVEHLGVHKKNRGAVYPGGVRCKSLLVEVVEDGFTKEEVNHACVAVEEIPLHLLISRGHVGGVVSASAYNSEKCNKDEILCTLFQSPYDDVRFTLLSHNHIMLVMRAFVCQAKWDIPANAEKHIT